MSIITSDIAYTSTGIAYRIDAMITEQRTVFAVITTRRSTSYLYGTIERRIDGVFRCVSPDGLSYAVFHPDDIEAIGNTCIFLKT